MTIPSPTTASQRLAAEIPDSDLRRLVLEVIDRSPRVASLRAEAAAIVQKGPQVKSLPDPTASVTWFVLSPQTRVGPQDVTINIAQRFPWFGELDLEEQAAILDAAAAEARVESLILELVTTTRTRYRELQYLCSEEKIVRQDRETLVRFEELARARYAAGTGLGQPVIKIQAEITRADARLLAIEERGVRIESAINRLRDVRASTPIRLGTDFRIFTGDLEIESLRKQAISGRPEVVEATALIDASATRIDISSKKRSPDLFVGLTYGFVGKRDDDAGRLNPPQGNGDDILGLTGGMTIPLWSTSLQAGEEEAAQYKLAAEERRRAVIAGIEGSLGDLVGRVPLLREQIDLFERVLIPQAEESLISVENAYATGTANALDLLDAERTLLTVRLGLERIRTDLAVVLARLEGTIAAPLTQILENGSTS
jgi:outer membrane protein TolC